MRRSGLSLTEYTDAVNAGWPDDDLGRAIIRDLPRRFHALSCEEQARVLSEPPPLTNTRWDALLPQRWNTSPGYTTTSRPTG